MDNGDVALFAFDENEGFWIGNTETPEALWRTEKYPFSAVNEDIADWAERELLAQLHQESPWLEAYPTISWFFLPAFLSKDGRQSTRRFFDEHAAGFPNDKADAALSFYESFLETGVFDEYRHLMVGKLGTSEGIDLVRMSAAMAEFNAAALLRASGYEVTPEAPVSTGHSIDYRVEGGEDVTLVEVTHPSPPRNRSTDSPVAAVKQTAETKVDGQLDAHGGGVVLFVDCSSFSENDWERVLESRPSVGHRPALVYRLTPSEAVEGYTIGSVPLELGFTSGPTTVSITE